MLEPSEPMREGWYRTELRALLAIGGPVTLTYLMQGGANIVSLMLVGQLGATELAGAALGFMFCNMTGVAVGIGLASALDTLCAQAYGAGGAGGEGSEGGGGDGEIHAAEEAARRAPDPARAAGRAMVGVHCQRGAAVLLLLCAPVAAVWARADALLLGRGSYILAAETRWILMRHVLSTGARRRAAAARRPGARARGSNDVMACHRRSCLS